MLRKQRVRADGPLQFIEPRFIPGVYSFMRLFSPAYTRLFEGIGQVETRGIENLIRAFQLFYARKARLLVAFRHASVHDAPLMVYLFCRRLPQESRRSGQKLGGLGHVHFLYARGVLHWAGGGASFLIPRIGGIPVMNRRNDPQGMRAIRHHLTDGRFPVCLAPEGQVTYHNHQLGPVENGTARLALWCLQDLERQGRSEEILIVPVAARYLYRKKPEQLLEMLLAMIESQGGLKAPGAASGHEKLLALTEQLITKIESFYDRFYGKKPLSAGSPLNQRIARICENALRVVESFLGLEPAADLLSRVFTVRQKGWDYLFRSDLPDRKALAPLDRLLADRIADETYLTLRHNELVDLLEYVRPDYIGPEASLNRLIEYALNLTDVINRLQGGDISFRYSPPDKKAIIEIDQPLKVRELYSVVPGGRHEKAQGITKVLKTRLESLVRER